MMNRLIAPGRLAIMWGWLVVLGCLLPAETGPARELVPDESPAPAGVYRVWFDSKADLDRLAVHFEPWEANAREGWAILALDARDTARLKGEGFELEYDAKRTDRMTRGPDGYPCYRDVPALYAILGQLEADHPDLCQLIDYGDSWQKTQNQGGYDLYALKLASLQLPGPKPRFFLMANVHARELATPETALHFVKYLLGNYGTDADVTWLLDWHEIYVILSANPDGRQLAEQGCLQRKNRNTTGASCTECDTWGSSHYGIDLNRNNPYHWGGAGTSLCEATYQGPSAGSEPENAALHTLVRSLFADQRPDDDTSPAPADTTGLLVTLHSYSNLVLWPWGWTGGDAPNAPALTTLGRKFAFFNGYTPQQANDLYGTTGDHTDWAYGELGIPAYTFEIGEDFFQDCSDLPEIRLENLQALLLAAKVCRAPYQTPAGPEALQISLSPSMAAPGEAVTLTAQLDDTRFNQSNGAEPTQTVAAAEYYLDTPPWSAGAAAHPLTAADGAFDEGLESVTGLLDTAGLPLGRHFVFVRGRDTLGNWGPVSAAFLYLADPATSPRVMGSVHQAGSGNPISATVTAGPFQVSSNPATGAFALLLPAGTYNLAATAPEHGPVATDEVTVRDGQTLHQEFLLTPIGTFFSDSVESGNLGWTADAPWAITGESSASPAHSWTDSPGENYASNRDVSLTSPVWDLTGASGVTLRFQHTYDLENTWDFGYVEFSTDGGANWSEAARYTGLAHTTWTPVELPLDALAGRATARVRFRFFSDGTIVKDGWHLDDIQLIASLPPIQGDLNGDGMIDASDPTILAAYLAGDCIGLPMGNATGDMDGDGAATHLDLVAILVNLARR